MHPILLVAIVLILGLLVFWLLASKQAKPQTSTTQASGVTNFDINRYTGKWYEQARAPAPFQIGFNQVTAEYTLISPTQINIKNCGVIATGEQKCSNAIATPTDTPGVLDVSFFPGVSDKYIVLYVADGQSQYEVSVVGSREKNYIWLLTRSKDGSEVVGDPVSFLKRIGAANGYSQQVLNSIFPTSWEPSKAATR